MKVLHIINNLNTGGAEKMIVELLPKLEDDIVVDLLLINKKSTEFLDQLKVCFKGNVFFINLGIYNPMIILKLKKYFKKYDLVHVHLFPCLYWVGLTKYLFARKTKLVFTEHSTNNRRIDNSIFKFFDKFIYKQYKLIIAITPDVKRKLVDKLNINTNKIIVINNGINIDKFTNLKKTKYDFKLPVESIILMQVSRFSAAKDQGTLIKSLCHLPTNICVVFVGSGNLEKPCQELVSELSLQKRVAFLGNRIDVPQLLASSDIVVQSSHWEGFGIAAVEGMAASKPVLASNVPGLSDVVGGAGLLFNVGDEKKLANLIGKLTSDIEYYKEISCRCRNKSLLYSIENTKKRLLECYKTLYLS